MFKDPNQIAEFLKKCGYTDISAEKGKKPEVNTETSEDIKKEVKTSE